MPIPQNKNELIDAIQSTYDKLEKDINRIPLTICMKKEMSGHAKDTLMSPYQLIAYLVGWADLVIDWNKKIEAGKDVHFPAENFKWTELGDLAQKFYTDYPDHDFNGIKKLLQQRVKKILDIIDSKTNKELYETNWYKEYTAGRMIQLNTSSPYKNARTRIRKFLRENSVG